MEDILKIVVVLALVALTASCGLMRFNECLRVHPFWYCATND